MLGLNQQRVRGAAVACSIWADVAAWVGRLHAPRTLKLVTGLLENVPPVWVSIREGGRRV
jgi:hypothetical protein